MWEQLRYCNKSCFSTIRQGYLLSAIPYFLYIDPLIRKIASSIGGIYGVPKPMKIAGFLDDITVFKNTTQELRIVSEIAEKFNNFTGAEMKETNQTTRPG